MNLKTFAFGLLYTLSFYANAQYFNGKFQGSVSSIKINPNKSSIWIAAPYTYSGAGIFSLSLEGSINSSYQPLQPKSNSYVLNYEWLYFNLDGSLVADEFSGKVIICKTSDFSKKIEFNAKSVVNFQYTDKILLKMEYVLNKEYGFELLDINTGQLIKKIKLPYKKERVEISPDLSKYMEEYLFDNLKIYDSESHELLNNILVKQIYKHIFSPDSKKIGVVCSNEQGREARVYDASNGVLLKTLKFPTLSFPGIYSCAFSPKGNFFAVGTDTGYAYVWNVESGDLEIQEFLNPREISQLSFSQDENILCIGSKSGKEYGVKVIDIVALNKERQYKIDKEIAEKKIRNWKQICRDNNQVEIKRLFNEGAKKEDLSNLELYNFVGVYPDNENFKYLLNQDKNWLYFEKIIDKFPTKKAYFETIGYENLLAKSKNSNWCYKCCEVYLNRYTNNPVKRKNVEQWRKFAHDYELAEANRQVEEERERSRQESITSAKNSSMDKNRANRSELINECYYEISNHLKFNDSDSDGSLKVYEPSWEVEYNLSKKGIRLTCSYFTIEYGNKSIIGAGGDNWYFYGCNKSSIKVESQSAAIRKGCEVAYETGNLTSK